MKRTFMLVIMGLMTLSSSLSRAQSTEPTYNCGTWILQVDAATNSINVFKGNLSTGVGQLQAQADTFVGSVRPIPGNDDMISRFVLVNADGLLKREPTAQPKLNGRALNCTLE